MAENNKDTYVTRETHVEKSRGSGMAFIVGGLVVAVLVIAYFLFAGGAGDMGAGNSGDAGGDTNVTVEAPEASASSGAASDGAGEGGGDAAADADTSGGSEGSASTD